MSAKEKLGRALEKAIRARACVAENRGYDKELAREGYVTCVYEEVGPALEEAVRDLDDSSEIMRVAKFVFNRLKD